MNVLKNRLKVIRAERNLTQEQIANLAGVTRQTIISIEKGDYAPSVAIALSLANALNVRVDDLFHLEHNVPPGSK